MPPFADIVYFGIPNAITLFSFVQITFTIVLFLWLSIDRGADSRVDAVQHAPSAARVHYIKLLVHPQSLRRSVIRCVSVSRSDLFFIQIYNRAVYFWVSYSNIIQITLLSYSFQLCKLNSSKYIIMYVFLTVLKFLSRVSHKMNITVFVLNIKFSKTFYFILLGV